MRKVFTIEDALQLARRMYKEERNPIIKGYYLKFGVTMKEMLDDGSIGELDEFDEYKESIYDRMEE